MMDNEVVISGIGGRYPEADNIAEFWDKLISGEELNSSDDRRWPVGWLDLPIRSGKIKNIAKFDADFFGFNKDDANHLDTQVRICHETSYEAICDAGINPDELRGSNTATYFGICYLDSEAGLREYEFEAPGFRTFPTSRLSHAFDFRGPALSVDTACASSFSALTEAYFAIKKGICDKALVVGLAVNLRPGIAAGFHRLNMISPDGRCKCLDASANGYCRSEAVVSLLLERKQDAKRIYGNILNCRTNVDGFTAEGITFPRMGAQMDLMEETYAQAGVDPLDVKYMEAHMTGTSAGDPIECGAIVGALRRNSTEPLLMGCLKSNMGHTEGASGVCAISKACLVLQKREIPPNLNFNTPNPHIEGLLNGILVPVNERMKFDEELIGVNSFGFGGVNVHCVLKANEKRMTDESQQIATEQLPRLVTISGRTDESIETVVKWLEDNPEQVTREFLKIYGDAVKNDPSRITRRAFALLDSNKKVTNEVKVAAVGKPVPLWFLCSGSEENWSQSANMLKALQPFARSVESSANFLNKVTGRPEVNEDAIVLNSVIGQMALIDLFNDIGLKGDGFVGHSTGEIVAAYATGLLNKEEALRVALLVEQIDPNNNGVGELKRIHDEMKAVIGSGRNRPRNWKSGDQGSDSGQKITADFFMGLTDVAPLDRAVSRDFDKATLVDMSLSNFVVRSGHKNAIALTDGKQVVATLKAIGQLHMMGHNADIDQLYPHVEYPVARETASISHLMRWDHSVDHLVVKMPDHFNCLNNVLKRKIDMKAADGYLTGHTIDERILLPATGYLCIVWETLVETKSISHLTNDGVEFRDVKFLRPTILSKDINTELALSVNEHTGQFILYEQAQACVTGFVKLVTEGSPDSSTEEFEKLVQPCYKDDSVKLTTKEIYKELRIRGYDYGPSFQGLVEANSDGSEGRLKWTGNWAAFADSMLHLIILSRKGRDLFLPTGIEYLKCDRKALLESLDSKSEVIMYGDTVCNMGCTKGLFMKGISGASVARRQNTQVATLESMQFLPYNENDILMAVDEKAVKYSNACKSLLNRISDHANVKASNIPEEEIQSLVDEDSKSNTLVQLLEKALKSEHPHDELTKLVTDSNLDCDQLLTNSLANDRMIRTQVDIVLENMCLRKLEISEYNQTGHFVAKSLTKHNKNSTMSFDYTGAHSKPGDVSSSLDFQVSQLSETFAKEAHLVVIKDQSLRFASQTVEERTLTLSALVDLAHRNVRKNGFLLLLARDQITDIEQAICRITGTVEEKLPSAVALTTAVSAAGFVQVSSKSDSSGFMSILFKKAQPAEEIANHQVFKVPFGADYNWVEEMKELLLNTTEEENKRIWLVTENEPKSGIIGLVNCLQKELGADRVRSYFNLSSKSIEMIPEEILKQDLIMNVFQDGTHGSYRFQNVAASKKKSKLAYLDVQTKGDMSSLKFFESPNKYQGKDTMDIDVAYSALNFKDIMIASGRIPLAAYPEGFSDKGCVGMEYSGTLDSGRRVMGVTWAMGIATTIRGEKDVKFLWTVPDHWSLADAATVPVAYATVIYAFFCRGKLQRGETVLIHSACGAVGQAAIHMAQNLNCNILVTVGTPDKREFIKETFGLKDEQIFNSRDHTFEENVLKATNGRGVDIVLNSLAEEKLQASYRCLAEFGRFLEIGKYDLVKNSNLPSLPNRTFHVICLATLEYSAYKLQSKIANKMCSDIETIYKDALESGVIQPLKHHIYRKEEAEKAFRFMSTGKHIGKVLIEMRKATDQNNNEWQEKVTVDAVQQTFFDSSKTVVIIGGLGGIGLELSRWAAEKGAKKIVLSSRGGVKNGYQQLTINKLREMSNEVIVLTDDVTTSEGTKSFIEKCQKLGQVGTIFNSALVLKDMELKDQTPATFAEVCASKVDTTVNLDILSRQLCPELDNFVCFSSVTSGRGNRGQTNYGYANSVMERICEQRKRDGLPGISVQWGAVGDVGVVAEIMGGNDIVIEGTKPQRLPSLLLALDSLMQSPHAVVSSIVHAEAKKSGAVKADVFSTILHILGIKDPNNVDENLTLHELGLDSLIAVEIRQVLERDYDRIMTNEEIRKVTVKELKALSLELSEVKESNTGNPGEDEIVKEIDVMLYASDEPFEVLNPQANGKPVLFFPPIQGMYQAVKKLVDQVNRPVIRCNWTAACDECMTIEQLAAYYIKSMIETYPTELEFELFGYSFGAIVALEMAAQLEKSKSPIRITRVTSFDGSPDFLRILSSDVSSQVGLDDKIVTPVVRLTTFANEVLRLPELDVMMKRTDLNEMEVLEEITMMVKNRFKYEIQPADILNASNRFFSKHIMAMNYKPTRKIGTEVKLVRAAGSELIMSRANYSDKFYGLKKICKGNLEQKSLSGDHGTFLTANTEEVSVMFDGHLVYA